MVGIVASPIGLAILRHMHEASRLSVEEITVLTEGRHIWELTAEANRAVLKRTGVDSGPIRHIVDTDADQGGEEVNRRAGDLIGLDPGQGIYDYEQRGHMGNTDLLDCPPQLMDGDGLQPSDSVLVASSGPGFTWDSTALEYPG